MGRGRTEQPHFYFYDIDNQIVMPDIQSKIIQAGCLFYETKNGFHVVSAEPLPWLEPLTDDKCPLSAVRVYPHTDYVFIQAPKKLCRQVFHIYASFFNALDEPGIELIPCTQPLKFGVYNRPRPL